MDRFFKWLATLLRDALSKAIVTFLAGVFLTLIALAFSARGIEFLRTGFTAPGGIVLVLSFLALLGVAAVAERVLTLARAASARNGPQTGKDQRLEETTHALLAKIVVVEVGLRLSSNYEVRGFTSELLVLFDQFETAVSSYLTTEEKEQLSAMREEAATHHLPNSRELAKTWVPKIKALSAKAAAQAARLS